MERVTLEAGSLGSRLGQGPKRILPWEVREKRWEKSQEAMGRAAWVGRCVQYKT